MTDFKPSSKKNNYVHKFDLHGHKGGIIEMAMKDDGRWLASAGTPFMSSSRTLSELNPAQDGLKIWDLEINHLVLVPRTSNGGRVGPRKCLAEQRSVRWHCEGSYSVLGVGVVGGKSFGVQISAQSDFMEKNTFKFVEKWYLTLNQPDPQEVTAMAYDNSSHRLTVCTRSGFCIVFRFLPEKAQLDFLYRITLADGGISMIPKAAAFGQLVENERDLTVFSLYSGDVTTYRGPDCDLISEWNVGGLIGDGVIRGSSHFLIDEPAIGAVLYRFEDRARIAAFPVPVRRKKRARKVAFAEEGKLVVSGSDHGVVYVFDRMGENPEPFDELQVDASKWVQTVLVRSSSDLGSWDSWAA
uniref:WD40 repeat-like protein n=1 Tax=Mycena chlorophos TaxID=658473 RepID=A0ABQ0L1F1_MYCCL|nr:predicted protein [Mycena chlorophos]